MLWTIVGGGGCVMVAIKWLGCIVAFPASLQFSSSLELKYQNAGQNTFLRWNATKIDHLTSSGATVKHFSFIVMFTDIDVTWPSKTWFLRLHLTK